MLDWSFVPPRFQVTSKATPKSTCIRNFKERTGRRCDDWVAASQFGGNLLAPHVQRRLCIGMNTTRGYDLSEMRYIY